MSSGRRGHRITERHIATPASRSSSSARSPSPGSRSTARHRVGQQLPCRSRAGRRRAPSPSRSSRSRARRPRRACTPAARRIDSSSVGDRLTGRRVAHREAGVAVLAVRALAHPRRVVGTRQVRVERRAPRVGDAVDRPDAAVLGEVRRATRDASPGCRRPAAPALRAMAISPLTVGTITSPAGHAQPARRVREVVLQVDDDERRPGPISLHVPRVAQGRCGTGGPSAGSASR